MNIISIVHYSNKCLTHATDPIKEFFLAQLNQLFTFTEYAPWKAFLGKCLNVICTFIWTYMDVFVMVMSVGLANRFAMLNDDLKRIKGKVYSKQFLFWGSDRSTLYLCLVLQHMSPEFWSMRRTQYRSLCTLCELVDGAISKITVVSFSNNLFFICVQLLRSLK